MSKFQIVIEASFKDRLIILQQIIFRKFINLTFECCDIHPDIKNEIIDEYLNNKKELARMKSNESRRFKSKSKN